MFKSIKISDSIPQKDELIRNSLDVDNLLNWEMVGLSAVVKKPFKNIISKFEIIQSYLKAAELLSQNINNTVKTLSFRSLGIPFLYLCRQTVELSIKFALEITNVKINKPSHNIKKLWEEFIVKNKMYISNEEKMYIDRITFFIDILNSIDCDGSHFRYAASNNEEIYREKPFFINSEKIVNELLNMVSIIHAIDIDLFFE